MDFSNEFRVSLPAGQAWALLTDLERIAPCMPGAQLTDVDGDRYNGVVKVKVGPMTVQYKGVATFEEQDVGSRTAVLRARGRDVRGQGNADARITARLLPDGEGTQVVVETRLTITGKVAQFGKGMIEEISKKLLAQFVTSLEDQLAAEKVGEQAGEQAGERVGAGADARSAAGAAVGSDDAAARAQGSGPGSSQAATAPAAGSEQPAAPSSTAPAAPVAPLDLMSVARGAVLKRAVPVLAALVVIIVVAVWLTR